MSRVLLLQGNQAVVEGAIAAGVRFYGGYPITPSTEIAEGMAKRLPQVGGKFMQTEDELAGIGTVLGASLGGAKAMTATSGPGFSLKQEMIGMACSAEIPCVIVDVQRVGPATGQPTSPSQGDVMQTRWGTHGDHWLIVVSPSSVPECFDLTRRAVELSEKYRCPVILLMDEIVGHMRERIELPDSYEGLSVPRRKQPDTPPEKYLAYADTDGSKVPAMADFGSGYRWHMTGLVHDETGFPKGTPAATKNSQDRLHMKLRDHEDDIIQVENYKTEDADVVVIAKAAKSVINVHADCKGAVRGRKPDSVENLLLVSVWLDDLDGVRAGRVDVSHLLIVAHAPHVQRAGFLEALRHFSRIARVCGGEMGKCSVHNRRGKFFAENCCFGRGQDSVDQSLLDC